MKMFTDRGLNNPDLLGFVAAENTNQLAKWGIQTRTPFEWLTLEFTGGVAVRVKRLVSRGFNYDLVGGFYGNTDARKTM